MSRIQRRPQKFVQGLVKSPPRPELVSRNLGQTFLAISVQKIWLELGKVETLYLMCNAIKMCNGIKTFGNSRIAQSQNRSRSEMKVACLLFALFFVFVSANGKNENNIKWG